MTSDWVKCRTLTDFVPVSGFRTWNMGSRSSEEPENEKPSELYVSNIARSHEINFSITEGDFIEAMRKEVDFLSEVNKYPLLFTVGPVLNNAVRR